MKTATVFIVSFWVITKYRSFVRKTKHWKLHKPYYFTRLYPLCRSFYVKKLRSCYMFYSRSPIYFICEKMTDLLHPTTQCNLIKNDKNRSSAIDYGRKLAGSEFLTKKNYNTKDCNPENKLLHVCNEARVKLLI